MGLVWKGGGGGVGTAVTDALLTNFWAIIHLLIFPTGWLKVKNNQVSKILACKYKQKERKLFINVMIQNTNKLLKQNNKINILMYWRWTNILTQSSVNYWKYISFESTFWFNKTNRLKKLHDIV